MYKNKFTFLYAQQSGIRQEAGRKEQKWIVIKVSSGILCMPKPIEEWKTNDMKDMGI